MLSELINQHKAIAILENNGHTNGFANCILVGKEQNRDELTYNKDSLVFFAYDYKNQIEKFHLKNNSPLRFENYYSFSVDKKLNYEEFKNSVAFADLKTVAPEIKPILSKAAYIHQVQKLKKHIQLGDIYETNFCMTFETKNTIINPLYVYSKLNSLSQAPYSALIKIDDKYIISASPELFLSKRGDKLISKPIKGTAPRSSDKTEDEKIKQELKLNLKERTENVMIVDVARNDFSRIAKKGTVQVDKLFDIESYKQVHQMVSTVSCELKENVNFNDIIRATFPMASMTGAPKIRAIELIDEYETYNRGPFSGTLGYIDENGDFDLSVLIRSIFYNSTEKYLSFSVGSAITAMCDPEKEYEECLLKAKALIVSLQ